jgi:hypothetical protein
MLGAVFLTINKGIAGGAGQYALPGNVCLGGDDLSGL